MIYSHYPNYGTPSFEDMKKVVACHSLCPLVNANVLVFVWMKLGMACGNIKKNAQSGHMPVSKGYQVPGSDGKTAFRFTLPAG